MNHLVSLKAVAAPVLCTVVALMAPAQVLAASEAPVAGGFFYAVAGLQYSKAEKYGQTELNHKDAGYSIGAGYRLNSQWAVELTAVQLMDKKSRLTPEVAASGIESRGVGLSVLGIAQLEPDLSLYYRAGVQLLKHELSLPYIQSVTQIGNTVSTTIAYHEMDSTKTQAILGLGLEQQWSANWSGRIEAEHTFKNDGIAFSTARLSAVYRF